MHLSDSRTNPHQGLMDIEAVQKVLRRSRASIYRYTNTEPHNLNPDYNPKLLNPELRLSKTDTLLFHPNEVARFAKEVLAIHPVTIQVQEPVLDVTQDLLRAILAELQAIRELLSSQS